jgi:hypothetical protein
VINSTAKSWSVNNSTFQFVDFTSLVLHLVFEIIINISFVPKKKREKKERKKKKEKISPSFFLLILFINFFHQ